MPLVDGFTTATSASATDRFAIRRVKEIKDQYMVGDALLVAPIAPGARTRSVVLPPGKWYDFYTGNLAGEHETITVTPPKLSPRGGST